MQFLPKFGEKWVFLGKRALTGFKYSNYLIRCKNSEKTNNPFLIEMPNCWWTDKQTEREPLSYRTLHRTGARKIKFGTECDSLWEGKNNLKLNPFIKTMVHRSYLHYSRIDQKGNWKKIYTTSSGTTKIETSQTPSSVLHLEGWVRYFRLRYSMKLLKNYMDSEVIKPHQCFLERFYAVLMELNI